MKKSILCGVLVLLGCIKTNAQEVTFGAKLGFNYANVTGDNSGAYDPLTSIHLGAMAELMFTEKFSFQPEILFSTQGFRSEEFDLKLKYMNIPLMAKYYVIKKFSVEMGPQIGLLSRATASELDVRDKIKPVDVALNFGVGYKFESGISLSARYTYGLININNIADENKKNQNVVAQISVGYFFF